jgi:membrane associated rhomboid family serine protease
VIPLRDTVPRRTTPYVTVALIVVNVLVFLGEASLGPSLEVALRAWGLVPAEFLAQDPLDAWRYVPLFTSMFLHGGWLHVGGNMLYLWIFGDNVEDRLGHFKFLLFYVACGVAAALTQVFFEQEMTVPMVGASGAIAGVLGAYFVLYPRARVLTFVPLFVFGWIVEVPAVVYLGMWFLLQLFRGATELGAAVDRTAGVAWWAHAGGFALGVLVGVLARATRPQNGPPRGRSPT